MNAPLFRLVYPRSWRGHKHRGGGRLFVTWPNTTEEVELTHVTNMVVRPVVSGAMNIDVTFIGSCEVEYTGDEPKPVESAP